MNAGFQQIGLRTGDTITIKKRRARKSKAQTTFRSLLEKRVASVLPSKVKANYEPCHITYTVDHKYTPDFGINDTSLLEVKGYFRASDRAKHLHIKEQHPELTVRFIFGDMNNKIHKNSKTTYADWCSKHGFEYCDLKSGIPEEWFDTTPNNS
jgi:hypothetical protein